MLHADTLIQPNAVKAVTLNVPSFHPTVSPSTLLIFNLISSFPLCDSSMMSSNKYLEIQR